MENAGLRGALRIGPLVRVPHDTDVEVNLFNDLDINHTAVCDN